MLAPLAGLFGLFTSTVFVGFCGPGYVGVLGQVSAPVVESAPEETSGIPVHALEQTRQEAEALRDAARELSR